MTLVQKELKNAYIGEVWTPGSNTIAYFPFKNDQLDHSGNGVTINKTLTKQTIGYSLSTGTSEEGQYVISNSSLAIGRYISLWYKISTVSSSAATMTPATNYGIMRYFPDHKDYPTQATTFIYFISSSSSINSSKQNTSLNTWYHLAYGCDANNNYKAWINGNLVWSGTASGQRYNSSTSLLFQSQKTTATYSDFIIEKELRTDQEIADYYNQTKANYGL